MLFLSHQWVADTMDYFIYKKEHCTEMEKDNFQINIFIPVLMNVIKNYPDIIVVYTTCDKNCSVVLFQNEYAHVRKFPVLSSNE